ncbi:hypothetical protein [Halalkalibacter oceani]|uniref:hypothetical protein n=1 Tax=Halalkalibacter oceani TaxID=1653776 RepID=UPI00339436B0
MKTELNHFEKQLILYTKGHFGRINYDQDLKYFASELYDIPVNHIDKYNILSMVVDIYQKMIDLKLMEEIKLRKFIGNIFYSAWMVDGRISKDDLLKRLLSNIQNASTDGKFSYDEVDFPILEEVFTSLGIQVINEIGVRRSKDEILNDIRQRETV